jgi:hypothetical protein
MNDVSQTTKHLLGTYYVVFFLDLLVPSIVQGVSVLSWALRVVWSKWKQVNDDAGLCAGPDG